MQSTPTGPYAVAVARVAFGGSTSISGITTQHMAGIVCSQPVPTEHRIGTRRLCHESGPGSLCICPAGMQHFTALGGPMDGIVLPVSPECLTLARKDLVAHGATLVERMDGEDPVLTSLAHCLAAEASADHPNGMLYWSTLDDVLLTHLTARHLSAVPVPLRATLSRSALKRVDEYISANLPLTSPAWLRLPAASAANSPACSARPQG